MNINNLADTINEKVQNLFFPKVKENNYNLDIYSNFHLPIEYLDDKLHTLDNNLYSDLELTPKTKNIENKESKSIYEYFLQPQNEFAINTLEKWKLHYTSNKDFIEDSKKIISNMDSYKEKVESNYTLDCERIKEIWKNIKGDDAFLQKYNYIDWNIFMHLNNSPNFLLGMSVIQIASPIISILLPIIFLLLPFILLKIQNIPINFYDYLRILKKIANNHFLGIAVRSFEDYSTTNMLYLLASLGFFLFQIYQNISTCKTFYNNIKKINNDIVCLRSYLKNSITKMGEFLNITKNIETYKPFSQVVNTHLEQLINMHEELKSISPFSMSINKFTSLGTLLTSYYVLFDNVNYAEAFKYSMAFEGYMDNLYGIHDNLLCKRIGLANVNNKKKCKFVNQYYPVIDSEESIKNDCDLEKNIIISSPNKSGKTTFLKTTLINIILTQQTGMGYYSSCVITPYTHVHCYLNIPDTSGRDSLFQAESRRCKEILDKISDKKEEKHFCIFDELYSGTNPEEATKAGTAFLKYLENYKNVDFILTTHYINVCKRFKSSELTKNYKMNVTINKDETFVYHYKIKKGISKIKGATRVLKDMNYPDEIIKSIENYK